MKKVVIGKAVWVKEHRKPRHTKKPQTLDLPQEVKIKNMLPSEDEKMI